MTPVLGSDTYFQDSDETCSEASLIPSPRQMCLLEGHGRTDGGLCRRAVSVVRALPARDGEPDNVLLSPSATLSTAVSCPRFKCEKRDFPGVAGLWSDRCELSDHMFRITSPHSPPELAFAYQRPLEQGTGPQARARPRPVPGQPHERLGTAQQPQAFAEQPSLEGNRKLRKRSHLSPAGA